MRVTAVVVTFNRLPRLQALVERLDQVPELDEILVVDNASTDGTSAWLAGLDPGDDLSGDRPSTPVLARTLDTNTGGAGGFATAMTWAVDRGADLIWLFDDDALPDPGTLATLLAYDDLDFWGPLVVDEADPDRLVFPIRLPGTTAVVSSAAAAAARGAILPGIVIPFNGVLVTRALVEQIGVPRAEFFIWGDDHEFRLRAEAAGARIATVTDAVVRHPSVGELGTPMMFGRTTYNHTPSDLKHYCMARNNLVNLRDYRGWPHALAFVAKTLWFYSFTRPNPGRIGLSVTAWWAALRGDFTGHLRYLARPAPQPVDLTAAERAAQRVAVVVVTYNRADLLAVMLAGLAAQTRPPDAVIVVDNASTDHTAAVLADATISGLQVITQTTNLGGAGGFHLGLKAAYDQGFDRIWLMDDDVVPAPDCLQVLLGHDDDCLMAVRESSTGELAEYAATTFDLTHPWVVRPKTASVVSTWPTRAAMPATVELANVAFEGFLVSARVVESIGLPDPSFFIFYDDCDYAIRAREAGFEIRAVRDARLIRQLDHSQQHDLAGWKGYYMYRNLFVVHFRHGTNAFVRLKPWGIAPAAALLGLLRGRPGETRNVLRALRDARRMRTLSPSARPA